MAQMVARGGVCIAPSRAVTVADLLTRNVTVPVKVAAADPGPEVSVGSLLRREGRAPHAVDRPVQPRAHRNVDAGHDAEPGARRALVRRSAIAAGALLAAGSAFGAAVLTDSSGTSTQDRPGGPHPGQGLLDGGGDAVPGGLPVALIDPTAQTGWLDAGVGPPMSWSSVAFPGVATGVPSGPGAGRTAPATSGAGPAPGSQAGSDSGAPTVSDRGPTHSGSTGQGTAAGGGSGSGNSGSGTGNQGGATSSGSTNPGSNTPSNAAPPSDGLGGTASFVGRGLERTSTQVGATLPAPVGGPVQNVGSAVGNTAATLGGAPTRAAASAPVEAARPGPSSVQPQSVAAPPQQPVQGHLAAPTGLVDNAAGRLGLR